MIDCFHEWTDGTLRIYSGHLRRLKRFEDSFGMQAMRATLIQKPPNTPAIIIAWAQLHHTIMGEGKGEDKAMSFNGTRGLRSAVGLFYLWDMQVAFPRQTYQEKKRGFTTLYASPTDEIVSTLQQGGMKAHMGNRGRKSHALKFQHILYLDQQLETRFLGALSPSA